MAGRWVVGLDKHSIGISNGVIFVLVSPPFFIQSLLILIKCTYWISVLLMIVKSCPHLLISPNKYDEFSKKIVLRYLYMF